MHWIRVMIDRLQNGPRKRALALMAQPSWPGSRRWGTWRGFWQASSSHAMFGYCRNVRYNPFG